MISLVSATPYFLTPIECSADLKNRRQSGLRDDSEQVDFETRERSKSKAHIRLPP